MSFTIILAVVYAALIGFAAAAFAKSTGARRRAACCGRGIDCRADVYVDQLADVT